MTTCPPIFSRVAHYLDQFALLTGRAVAWLMIVMVVLQTLVVLLRYGFDFGSIALQESVTYLHAACFMLGAAFTLKIGGHVRVDIFYRNFSPRKQACVDLAGSIVFLLPLTLVILLGSMGYVEQAWSIREASPDPGGIPGVFLLKTLIPLLALTLLLQALADIMRNSLALFEAAGNNGDTQHD